MWGRAWSRGWILGTSLKVESKGYVNDFDVGCEKRKSSKMIEIFVLSN